MLVYIYDGSFEGLLTAIYEAYYRKQKPSGIVCKDNMQISLVEEQVDIATDPAKSDKVYFSIIDKISQETLEKTYYVFLSSELNKEMLIFEYLRLGWKLGSRVNLDLANEAVLKVHKISSQVSFEAHRLKGFVRFKALEGGIYYAVIEPDNNILELLAPHFAERYQDQDWMIHDKKRKQAAVFNGLSWTMIFDVPEFNPVLCDDEQHYNELWKKFFKTIAIDTRKNQKLQKRLMPVRYWKHLVEFE